MGSTHLHDDGAPEHSHMIVIDTNGNAGVSDENVDSTMGGCFTKCCPHLFGAVDAQWKMYPIGFLFGLGNLFKCSKIYFSFIFNFSFILSVPLILFYFYFFSIFFVFFINFFCLY